MGQSTKIFSSIIRMGIKILAATAFLFSGTIAQSQYRPGSSLSGSGGRPGSSGGFGVGFGAGSSGGFGGNDAGFGGSSSGSEESLEEAIPGIPGEDYPIFGEVPESSFVCDGQVDGGYYADPAAECQAFHICGSDGNGGLTKYSFLCPNGTLFNQQYFVCDWWFNVDCSLAEELYSLNDEYNAERQANSPEGSDGGGQYGGASGGRNGGQGGRSNGGNGGRGGSGSRSSGSQGSASSSRGTYSAPNGFGGGSSFGGQPGSGDSLSFGANSGYGAPPSSYEVRRRNSRDIQEILPKEIEQDL